MYIHIVNACTHAHAQQTSLDFPRHQKTRRVDDIWLDFSKNCSDTLRISSHLFALQRGHSKPLECWTSQACVDQPLAVRWVPPRDPEPSTFEAAYSTKKRHLGHLGVSLICILVYLVYYSSDMAGIQMDTGEEALFPLSCLCIVAQTAHTSHLNRRTRTQFYSRPAFDKNGMSTNHCVVEIDMSMVNMQEKAN